MFRGEQILSTDLKRLLDRVWEMYPYADREAVIRLIGKEPEE